MKKLLFFCLALAGGWATQAQVFTQTYTSGDIFGVGQVQNSTNDISPCHGVLTFTGLPVGANVDSVRVVYDFFSAMAGFQSPNDQRSYINCPTTGLKEANLAATGPVGIGVTTVTYSRLVSVANGILTSNTLTFELHAGTTALIPGSCTGSGHVVFNNTWTVTVYVSGSAACPEPTNLSTTSTTNSIAFDWIPGGSEAQWQFAAWPEGFPLGSAVPAVTSTHPVTMAGLDSAASYDFYVRAICGPGDTGLWSGPITAMTDTPVCASPTDGVVSNVTETEAAVGWSQSGFSSDWQLKYGPQGFAIGSGTFVSGAQCNPWVLQGLSPDTEYEVYIRNNCVLNESDWLGPFPFTTLDPSIGLVEESNGVRLYPNPTTGKIYVESAVTQDFEIRDAQGKLVVDGHLAVGQNIIDLANLAEGWYVFCSSTHAYPIILNR